MTEVQPETKLFAKFGGLPIASLDLLDALEALASPPSAVEVKDVQEAVKLGTNACASFFQTHEVTSATLDGEVLTGQPKNMSGKHYLGVDKILTAAEIVAICEEKIREYRPKVEEDRAGLRAAFNGPAEDLRLLQNRGMHNQELLWAYEAGQDECKGVPPSTLYIANDRDEGSFIKLTPDITAYNKQGQQIWPKPEAPSSKALPRGPRS